MQMCWILGLTGGAGSGKSTAADIFRELGHPIIDADRISRAVTAAGGAAVPAIRQAFGPEMIEISGAMNRARMRELVFRDPEARKKLEAIVHSAMKQVLDDEFACAKRSGAPFAVYDCPLLIESPQARARVDRILVIDVPEYLQVERLGTRSGLAPDAALRLIRAQTSRRNRLQGRCACQCRDSRGFCLPSPSLRLASLGSRRETPSLKPLVAFTSFRKELRRIRSEGVRSLFETASFQERLIRQLEHA